MLGIKLSLSDETSSGIIGRTDVLYTADINRPIKKVRIRLTRCSTFIECIQFYDADKSLISNELAGTENKGPWKEFVVEDGHQIVGI